MKLLKQPIIYALGLLVWLGSCTIEEPVNPNATDLDNLLANPTVSNARALAVGIEDGNRKNLQYYFLASGTIARELYLFNSDPRMTGDLLGKDGVAAIDNNTFYITGPWFASYRTIKNCNILLEIIDQVGLSTEEVNGYKGYANTIKALNLYQMNNYLGSNGVRIEVADPLNPGPFVTGDAALQAIGNLLDEANTQLLAAGGSFHFPLSSGFDNFNDPASFATFNRALKARVELFRGNYANAITELGSSFADDASPLTTGPQYVFSTVGIDFLNPVFRIPGQSGDQVIVHDDVIASMEAGDTRISKFAEREPKVTRDGLNGDYESALYSSNTAPVSLMRNEELLLIRAEAEARTGALAAAEATINIIRNAYGLANYSGAQTEDALVAEVLNQRRFSLWGEGHRMFDLRRMGMLNSDNVSLDRAGDQVFTEFPKPLPEVNAGG